MQTNIPSFLIQILILQVLQHVPNFKHMSSPIGFSGNTDVVMGWGINQFISYCWLHCLSMVLSFTFCTFIILVRVHQKHSPLSLGHYPVLSRYILPRHSKN